MKKLYNKCFFHYCIIIFMRSLSESPFHISDVSRRRIVRFLVQPEISEESDARAEFRELTRRELSSRRLVPSQRYLFPKRGTPSSPKCDFVSIFPSPPRTLRQGPRQRKEKTRQRIANHESHEIASSAASQRQTRPTLEKPLSAHYRL